MTGWVYLMTNKTHGTLYVGVTSNLRRRAFEHRSGQYDSFSRRYGLKHLVLYEEYPDIRLAIQREHNIKHWPRDWKIDLINKANPEWADLYEDLSF
ncbi:GIY-YIG nuclease family protein [Chelatococcus reniformis]|uniref:Excinuclease ABC subunit C n=1 Tax=Chelatococcus reniformis TaxID=1494448 RepID=A0A916UAT3_9HYPH|nr:GIY-YIG nuclease family protein [Chelatococcus reniformis]GGC66201.1 excinuclease ABC subunit C [Chelatococcus reniformis]